MLCTPCQIIFYEKQPKKFSNGVVCMMIQIHYMAAAVVSFSLYRVDEPNRWHFHIESHTRYLKVYMKNKISV